MPDSLDDKIKTEIDIEFLPDNSIEKSNIPEQADTTIEIPNENEVVISGIWPITREEAEQQRDVAIRKAEEIHNDLKQLGVRLVETEDAAQWYQTAYALLLEAYEALDREYKILETSNILVKSDNVTLYRDWKKEHEQRKEYQQQLAQKRTETIGLLLALMKTDNQREHYEFVVSMYEQRFGSREQLFELAREEEQGAQPQYHTIEDVLHEIRTGEQPETPLQRIATAFELFVYTALDMLNGVYSAVVGKRKEKLQEQRHENHCDNRHQLD